MSNCSDTPAQYTLVQGDEATIMFLFRQEDDRVFKLNSATVSFNLKINNAIVNIAGVITDAQAGEATLTLTEAQTDLMAPNADGMDVDGIVIISGVTTTVKFYNAIVVQKRWHNGNT
jgi:hypothetical protein